MRFRHGPGPHTSTRGLFLTGQDVVVHIPQVIARVVAVTAVGNAVLALPAAVAVRWAIGPDDRRAATS